MEGRLTISAPHTLRIESSNIHSILSLNYMIESQSHGAYQLSSAKYTQFVDIWCGLPIVNMSFKELFVAEI